MHAEQCPVCKGKGTIPTRDIMIHDYRYTNVSYIPYPIEDTCYGCQGKGWVEVHDRFECPISQNK